MAHSIPMQRAGRIIRAGGVVAYPTEGVYGLGCLPHSNDAIWRILAIKQRDPALGLILIAADPEQLRDWVDDSVSVSKLASTLSHPITWIVPAAQSVPYLLQGRNAGIAVRITQHPVAAALSREAGCAIVSTSANVSGRPPARTPFVLRREFGHLVDCFVPGPCGPATGASEIRDWRSGRTIRPAKT